MNSIVETIRENKIIAIIRDISNEKIIDTCEALYLGGIKCIEVTFNQSSSTGNEDTYNAIKEITEKFGEKICVGAGTVMTEDQVELAIQAGAKYIVSPNFNKGIVAKSIELGAVSIPGVVTPTEIAEAYKAGASFVKIFPVGNFGVGYLKAIKSPLSHIPMLAVGGIDLGNVGDYMASGIDGVGIGSSLVHKTIINEGRFDELTELAKKIIKRAQ